MKVGDLVTARHWDGLIAVVVNNDRFDTEIVKVLITVDGESHELDQLVQDLEVLDESR